jgi:hypothetical protein
LAEAFESDRKKNKLIGTVEETASPQRVIMKKDGRKPQGIKTNG